MFKGFKKLLTTAMSTKIKREAAEQSLGRRLAKNKLKQKVGLAETKPEIPDIEEAAASITSPYFSPLQTRHQRKTKSSQAIQNSSNDSMQEAPAATMNQEKKVKPVNQNKTFAIKAKEESVETNMMESTHHPPKLEWEPPHWQQALQNIREMRASVQAPVDTMGCDKCSDDSLDEKTQRFHKLVALMLSSQTKDETTFEAMRRLRKNNLTPQSIVDMQTSDLEQLLNPVSFYKNKAKFLQKTSRILIDKYGMDIPNNVKELVALPGVGPKMAHICMATAWNEVTGIGVDVHVHRISNRLRWVQKETKEPEQTRMALEKWLPRELWREVNHLLVGFGQTVCTPVRPHCGDCLNRGICPSVDKSATKNKKEIQIEEDSSDLSPIKKAKFQKKKLHL